MQPNIKFTFICNCKCLTNWCTKINAFKTRCTRLTRLWHWIISDGQQTRFIKWWFNKGRRCNKTFKRFTFTRSSGKKNSKKESSPSLQQTYVDLKKQSGTTNLQNLNSKKNKSFCDDNPDDANIQSETQEISQIITVPIVLMNHWNGVKSLQKYFSLRFLLWLLCGYLI